MQEFLQEHSLAVWGVVSFACFCVTVSSILNAIRDGTDKIVNAITSLELALRPIDNNDDHPMYRPPDS
jgi:hypothetical protein